jgi:integrase
MTTHKAKKSGGPETVKCGSVVVKIYNREKRVGGRTYTAYEVADFTGGRRKMRSFNDHGKARSCAADIARRLAQGESTMAAMRNTDAASYARALELLKPSGTALETACATYSRAVEALGGDMITEAVAFYLRHSADKLKVRTVADVVDEVLQVKERRSDTGRPASKVYHDCLRQRLTKFKTAFQVNISSISTADLQSWYDATRATPDALRTTQKAISVLMSFAESRGYIHKGGNPTVGTEKARSPHLGKIGIITVDEMRHLLNTAPKGLVPFLAIAAFGGLRVAEIERLHWQDIDLDGGWITVAADKAKTAARRLVPIQPNLKAWLELHRGKGAVIDPQERRNMIRAWGADWPKNGLRHSYISYRLAVTKDVAATAMEAGNSAPIIFKHYRELVKPDQGAAWFGIQPLDGASENLYKA